MARNLLQVLLVINGLLLPCACLPTILIACVPTDFGQWFITTIHITNATDQPLWVTPIGVTDAQGTRRPLPMPPETSYLFEFIPRGGFLVKPSSTIDLEYDWDDINLSEIVVENAAGKLGQIIADPMPQLNQFHPADPDTFTITDFETLQPVPANVAAAYRQAQRPFTIWPRLLVTMSPWLTFAVLFWLERRTREPGGDGKAQ